MMTGLPSMAISIRQPWAWAIVNAGKDVENRTWRTRFRGQICIHAAVGMTKHEFDFFVDLARTAPIRTVWPSGIWVPEPPRLERGGIVGVAEVVDCVSESASPWFSGPFGFKLANARPVPFVPVRGALGIFKWWRKETCFLDAPLFA